MSERIKRLYTSKGLRPPKGKGEHTEAFHRCVTNIMARTKKTGKGPSSPHAVCMRSLGPDRAIKKSHRRYSERKTTR